MLRDPFSAEDESSLYVPRPASEEALAALRAAIQDQTPATLLLGPVGIGKSMLLRVLENGMSSERCCVRVEYPGLSGVEFCQWILRELDAREALETQRVLNRPALAKLRDWVQRDRSYADAEDPEQALVQLASEYQSRGFGVLVLVDAADTLKAETAQRLTELAQRASGALSFVFALTEGVPELDALRQALGPSHGTVRYATPMTLDETLVYVKERLTRCQASEELRACLDESRIRRIHKYSEGNPRRLHGELGLIHLELSRVRAGAGVPVRTPSAPTPAAPERPWLRPASDSAPTPAPVAPPTSSLPEAEIVSDADPADPGHEVVEQAPGPRAAASEPAADSDATPISDAELEPIERAVEALGTDRQLLAESDGTPISDAELEPIERALEALGTDPAPATESHEADPEPDESAIETRGDESGASAEAAVSTAESEADEGVAQSAVDEEAVEARGSESSTVVESDDEGGLPDTPFEPSEPATDVPTSASSTDAESVDENPEVLSSDEHATASPEPPEPTAADSRPAAGRRPTPPPSGMFSWKRRARRRAGHDRPAIDVHVDREKTPEPSKGDSVATPPEDAAVARVRRSEDLAPESAPEIREPEPISAEGEPEILDAEPISAEGEPEILEPEPGAEGESEIEPEPISAETATETHAPAPPSGFSTRLPVERTPTEPPAQSRMQLESGQEGDPASWQPTRLSDIRLPDDLVPLPDEPSAWQRWAPTLRRGLAASVAAGVFALAAVLLSGSGEQDAAPPTPESNPAPEAPPRVVDTAAPVEPPTQQAEQAPADVTAAPPEIAPAAPRVLININSRPWARIEIDGEFVGTTPLGELSVTEGPHEFRATFPMQQNRVVERTEVIGPDNVHIVFP